MNQVRIERRIIERSPDGFVITVAGNRLVSTKPSKLCSSSGFYDGTVFSEVILAEMETLR